jgi:hypothetical protein
VWIKTKTRENGRYRLITKEIFSKAFHDSLVCNNGLLILFDEKQQSYNGTIIPSSFERFAKIFFAILHSFLSLLFIYWRYKHVDGQLTIL